MTTRKTSRRSMLAGLAAAPVAGVPAIAFAVGAPDHIFAAIERHKAAHAAYIEACNLTDEVRAEKEQRVIGAEDEAIFERASAEESAALKALAKTPPSSVAGLLAALDYLRNEDHRSLVSFIKSAVESAALRPLAVA